MAKDNAFMKNGKTVKSGIYSFNSYLSAKRAVQSMSSEIVKVGIYRAWVIVFTMAFLIPLTLIT